MKKVFLMSACLLGFVLLFSCEKEKTFKYCYNCYEQADPAVFVQRECYLTDQGAESINYLGKKCIFERKEEMK